MTTHLRRALVFLAKLLVSGVCLAWVLGQFDPGTSARGLERLGAGVVVFAVLLHLGSYLAGALRWWLLLRFLRQDVGFLEILPSYYMGVFFNNFLPSGFGGDVARSVQLYARGMSGLALATSALLDRLLGFIAVIVLGLLVAFWWPAAALGDLPLLVFGTGLLGVFLLLAISHGCSVPGGTGARVLGRWPRLLRVVTSFAELVRHPGLLANTFLLSVLNQLLVVWVVMVCAQAFGIAMTAADFVLVVFLAFLTMALPISLGGLGVREGVFVGLLLRFGVEPGVAVLLSLAYLVVLWLTALPGGLVWLFQGRRVSRSRGRQQ